MWTSTCTSVVVACVLKGEPGQEPVSETKSFGTTSCELMEMVEWLKGHGVTHAAMEATGNFWMPVYNLLEGHFSQMSRRRIAGFASRSLRRADAD